MKNHIKNLLSRKVYLREAPTFKLSKIKLRFPKKFRRLTNIFSKISFISLILIFLSGYYPVFAFPPIKSANVLAQSPEQKQEIIASSFPQPISLPHPGYLSTKFSAWHPGVDIATGLGMPIHPITSGVVEEVNIGFFGYGNYVVVSHANGFKSLYGHMGKVYAKKGQTVSSENILGEVGLTGHTSGPHTHLEITKDGAYIDPLKILPEIPDMPAPPRGEPKEEFTKQSLPLK